MDIRRIVGQNVRRARLKAKLSQEGLAHALSPKPALPRTRGARSAKSAKPDDDQPKADQAYISRIEAGKINLTLDTIRALAEALNVELAELFKTAPEASARRK